MMDGPPDFVYRTVPATNNGKSYLDFHVECRVKYTQMYAEDDATFSVTLVAESLELLYPRKIVHADNLNVIFNSSEVLQTIGHTVSESTPDVQLQIIIILFTFIYAKYVFVL
jgi:hypothetical protein